MTKQETMAMMAILREAYPLYYRDKTKDEIISSVNLWAEMFADDDANLVIASIKAFIASDTKGFPPVIGQIKHQIQKLTEPEELGENEAWSLVSKAVGNSFYNSVEEFEKLPPVVRQSVGSARMLQEWAQMDASEVQSVVASNFMRTYRVKLKYAKEYRALPNDIKALTDKMHEKQSALKRLTW